MLARWRSALPCICQAGRECAGASYAVKRWATVAKVPRKRKAVSPITTVEAEASDDTDTNANDDKIQVSDKNAAQSAIRSERLAYSKPDVVRSRPPLTTFKRGGFARDLLQNLHDFPHALLLTRVGQFYESYFDQAIEVADLLKIRLTTKSMESKRYPMCGFPIAQMDKFLEKLVREHNQFVAICEETKKYKKDGSLLSITRKVVRVVTPGTLVDEAFIEKQEHNFLLAINMIDPDSSTVELAWIDTSTGELFTQASSPDPRVLYEDLARINPAEIVLPLWMSRAEHGRHSIHKCIADLDRRPKVTHPHVASTDAEDATSNLYDVSAQSAVPLLSAYINETLLEHQPDLSHPLRVKPANTMRIDRVSLKALEMRQNNDGGRSGTLLSVLDHTVTSAGMRLLSDRIASPSKSLSEINSRLSLVALFKGDPGLRDQIIARLRQLDDEARLLQKMSIGRPTADDLVIMARAIRVHTDIKTVLNSRLRDMADIFDQTDLSVLRALTEDIVDHDSVADHIESSVDVQALEARRIQESTSGTQMATSQPEPVDENDEEGIDVWNIPASLPSRKRAATTPPEDAEKTVDARGRALPTAITWGKQEAAVMQPNSSAIMSNIYDSIIRVEGRAKRFHRDLLKQMNAPPAEILLRVVPRFGPVLRIGWKKSHTMAMRDSLTDLDDKGVITLVRKAASARLYAHNHWTKLNSEMQGLLVQLREAESYAVRELCDKVLTYWHTLRRNANITAELDVSTALAKAADALNLSRPNLDDSTILDIVDGRHPVAESELSKEGRQFIPNSTYISNGQRLHVVTGPNMGGKSTALRQVGIIVAMAQAGSFVPARAANIGIVDQLFARIRYSDNIARGRSSFRVEMDDAAYILEHATDRSLVLLDEFGRGTTADYAACIAESTIYALAHQIRARSLFATHLHDIYDIINDGHAERDDIKSEVAFFCTRMSDDTHLQTPESLQYLYRLEPGVNRNAEAFKVASLAGYPQELLSRAQRIYAHRGLAS